MEEFSDLDEETGTNIAHINNNEISRNIVEPIEYQFPDLNNKFHTIKQIDDLYSNLINNNNNLISLENNIDNNFTNNILYPKKNYISDFDKLIDQEFNNNIRPKNFEIKNKNYLNYDNGIINKIKLNDHQKENLDLNRFLEITKNYNKIPKREKTIQKNAQNENLTSHFEFSLETNNDQNPRNAFASNVFKYLNFFFIKIFQRSIIFFFLNL